MRWLLLTWLLASAVGAVLLASPDQGPRLIAFSGAHGLTLLDTAAVAILIAGWLPVAATAWRRRHQLATRVGRPGRRAATFLAGVGIGLLIASVFGDFEGWWVVGATLLAAIQVTAFLILARS